MSGSQPSAAEGAGGRRTSVPGPRPAVDMGRAAPAPAVPLPFATASGPPCLWAPRRAQALPLRSPLGRRERGPPAVVAPPARGAPV